MKIWTRRSNPFVMGGNVNEIICTHMQSEFHAILQKKYVLHQFTDPDSAETAWVEETTGGVVGCSLDEICDDILNAEIDIGRQLIEMKSVAEQAVEVDQAEFWAVVKETRETHR